MKWYPADWRQEPTLRVCSRAARSLWQDMLGLMHEAEPYGYLTFAGKPMTVKQLAAILGDREKDIEKWLAELSEAGVYSVDERGCIYSRRMVRDKEKADRDRANGRHGGNPALMADDNGGVNPPDKAHMPEARVQIPEKEIIPEFENWYRAYPKHVGRGQALKAYRTARKKADAEALLQAAIAAKRRFSGTSPEFIPHPATWLNGERWLDQMPEAQPPPKQDFNL